MYSVLDNLQRFICHKSQTTKPTLNLIPASFIITYNRLRELRLIQSHQKHNDLLFKTYIPIQE